MRLLICTLLTCAVASADSNPAWWIYASPEATALVGVQWENLRKSPISEALSAEFSTGLGFPQIQCLAQAREMVISSPALLAMAAGDFPAAAVKQQAIQNGLHGIKYRGISLWLPPKPADLGIAQISEQLLLIGSLKTLEAAIDNSSSAEARRYSPLLPRAARFSKIADLWVVASHLPDPLANRFVPLSGAAQSFEGFISLRYGLEVEAWVDAGTPNAGPALAKSIRQAASGFPAFARDLQVTEEGGKVALMLQDTPEQFAASFGPAPEPAAAAPGAKPIPNLVAKSETPALPTPPAPVPAAAPAEPAKPAKPLVIRIVGLDDGPREIPFPPVP